MADKYYKTLELDDGATLEDLEKNYKSLLKRYNAQLFEDGEAGSNAAQKLTEIKNAYDVVYESLLSKSFTDTQSGGLDLIYDAIRNKNADKAQEYLDKVLNKNAVYHYLQSAVFYLKEWYEEAIKHLQYAIDIQPEPKYYKAMVKLRAKSQSVRQSNMTDEERMEMMMREMSRRNGQDEDRF
jgi:tetratricopeptide (TPR) repeat protein